MAVLPTHIQPIIRGTLAERPEKPAKGRLYIVTDAPEHFTWYDGTQWIDISVTGGGTGSVTSAEVQVASVAATSVNSRVTSLNAYLSGLSVFSVGGVSTHGLQSVFNALSNRISATAAGTGSVTSTEVSAGDASVYAKAVSDNASLSAVLDAHASAASAAATSVDGRVTSLNLFLSGLSVRSVGNISTHGLQSLFNALSNRISAGGGTGGAIFEFLSSTQTSTGSSFSVVSIGSSIYEELIIELHDIAVGTDNNNLNLRFVSAGGLISTQYNWTTFRHTVTGGTGARGGGTTSLIELGDAMGGSAPQMFSGTLRLFKPFGNSWKRMEGQLTYDVTGANVYFGATVAAVWKGTDPITALHFSLATGNFLSGKVYVYGLKADPASGGTGSVTSAEVQIASAAATSVDARVTSLNTFLSGISARSTGNVSTHGLQSVVNALSNRISAGGGFHPTYVVAANTDAGTFTTILLTSNTTLAGWYYLTNPLNNFNPIWSLNGQNEVYYGDGGVSGKLAVIKGNTIIYRSATTLQKDGWHFVVITDNGTSIKGYEDNVDLSNTVSYATMSGMPLFRINQGVNSNNFRGYINQPAIWNRALTADEISALYNGGAGRYGNVASAPFNTGLVAGWHLNEGGGVQISDYSGNGHTMSLNSPAQWSPFNNFITSS